MRQRAALAHHNSISYFFALDLLIKACYAEIVPNMWGIVGKVYGGARSRAPIQKSRLVACTEKETDHGYAADYVP